MTMREVKPEIKRIIIVKILIDQILMVLLKILKTLTEKRVKRRKGKIGWIQAQQKRSLLKVINQVN